MGGLPGIPGPAGPDGSPIGTIISFIGTKAPKDYLICDGAEYLIADHSELAKLLLEQFGAANYFGGDGTAAFSVPDMRNLFLRGYHGESEEQLSGEIGKKQDGTVYPHVYAGQNGIVLSSEKNVYASPENRDSYGSTKNGS